MVSNHPDLAARAENYGIPFYYLPVTKETKTEQESEILNLLFECGVNLVVLARYLQILSPEFVSASPSAIINTSTTRSSRPSPAPILIAGLTRGA